MATLHHGERPSRGRLPEPSACCVDSQSIKTKTATQADDVGFNGSKKINRSKRPIVIDILRQPVAVVTPANTHDRHGLVVL
jgi:putative transposase